MRAILKRAKDAAYKTKLFYKDVFKYPRETIDVDASLDYDNYWQDKRGSAVGTLSDWQQIRAQIVVDALAEDKDISIGDIGCGEGSILKYIIDHASVSRTVGYDSSAFVLDKAKAIGVTDVHQVDITLPEDLATFERVDYNMILEVLEHIPESERVLRAAYDSADKGVFFSFPNTGYFKYRLRLLFGKFPKQWVTFPNEHLRFWTSADLKFWLRALGYTDYRIFYYKGVPGLNKIWPSLFAAAFVVLVRKRDTDS